MTHTIEYGIVYIERIGHFCQKRKGESMDCRLIALDLDGTLNNSKGVITPQTKRALIRAQEKGAKVVLASGRPLPGLYQNAKDLEFDRFDGYLLCFNGAKICTWKERKIIYDQSISPGMAQMIYDYNIRNDYNMVIMSYEGDAVLAEDLGGYRVQEEAALNKMGVTIVPSVRDTLTHPVNKLLFAAKPEYLADIEMEFKKPFVGQLSIYRSAPFYLEVMATGIDKARSLHRLVNHMGIDRNQIIAFGDGYNDISMIEYAGLGIAMGNAVEELKRKADGITDTNDEDGIALALEEYFLD